MTMSFIRAFFTLLFLLCAGTLRFGVAQAAELENHGGKEECESKLEGHESKELPKKAPQFRARIFNRIESAAGSWLAWHQQDQRFLLAAVDAGHSLKIFEPTKNDDAFFTGRWSSPDGQTRPFTRAEWVDTGPGSAMILAGDHRGNLLTFEPLHHPDPVARFQGSKVPVLPYLVGAENQQTFAALGLVDLSRVRIVPVGSWNDGHDIHVRGPILSMSAHRTPYGESLIAVMTESAVDVFKLQSGASERIFSYRLQGSSVSPRWVVSESGESLLIAVGADSKMNVLFPETKSAPIVTDSLGLSTEALQVLTGTRGVWVLIKGCKSCQPRVFQIVAKEMVEVDRLPKNVELEDENFIFAGPGKEPLMFSTQGDDETKSIVLTDLHDLEVAPLVLPLDAPTEVVKGFDVIDIEPGRALAAVQTNVKIYAIEITARR